MTTTQKDDLVPDPKTATPGKVVNHVQSDDKGTLFGKATIDGCTGKTRENFPPTVFKNNFEKEVLSVEFCNQLCLDAPCDPEGRFLNFEAVLDKLKQAKPGIANWSAKMAMENIENENVANHSKAPLPVAHDLTQPSGLDTPPAESSLTKPILPSSNASGCSRSSPISAHEEKILTTNQVFSQKETVDLPISVERAHKDDGAAVSDEGGDDKETPRKSSPQENAASAKATRDYPAEQGSATRSVEESVAQTATTSLVTTSKSMAPEFVVKPERKSEVSSSQRSALGSAPREVPVFQTPSVEKSKPSTSIVNQPFMFSAGSKTTDGTKLQAKSGIAQTVAPNPSLLQQSTIWPTMPQPWPTVGTPPLPLLSVYKFAANKQSSLSQPAPTQVTTSSSATVVPPVSKTKGTLNESLTQVMSSRDTNLDSALSNAGSIDTQSQRLASTSTSIPAKAHTPSPATPDPDEELHKWIYEMYHEIGFQDNGVNFIGHKEFKKRLYALRPNVMQSRIRQAHALLSGPGHKYSFPAVSALQKQKAKARREQQLNAHGSTPTPGTAPTVATQPKDSAQQWPTSQVLPPSQPPVISSATSGALAASPLVTQASGSSVSAMRSVPLPLVVRNVPQPEFSTNGLDKVQISSHRKPDFAAYAEFLKSGREVAGGKASTNERAIKQGPLLSGEIIDIHSGGLVPQYGLLGHLAEQDPRLSASQIFSNPNTPASVFICGVQGSGKSHTTACLLENSVISTDLIGQLHGSVSCLVYSWSYNSGSSSFSISEAAYLGASLPQFPRHHAKRVTVLYSPSNPIMRRHYERLPNVRAIPFYLNFRKLTISAMLTLMAVDESSKTPLYLAEVEKILRLMQKSNGGDTVLDYAAFKKKIKEAGFTRDQMQPLQIRLNILDSFLDLNGTAEEPTYEPGEVTIMDLSDDTMSSSTACALFKLGMNDYLGSSAKGKMIVLDEAHKYMQDTPGAHLFTQGLKRVVTQMRHYGCRVVISTQEPTVANELIALCSITIMHRFTSPAWFSALKKHISVMEDNSNIMEQIEGLNTGEALVYAPGAVLGKNVDDSLVKATAQLLRIVVRDRLTQDGGESILAV